MNIASDVTGLIGNTPLVRLTNIARKYAPGVELIAKIEGANPGGSAKDRIALKMIEAAERDGRLPKGGTVIEPTSGNTGIGICAVCAARGYHAVIVMPDTMSEERRRLVKAYGAQLVLTDGKLGMKGSIEEAERIRDANPGSIIAGQFVNPANPQAHYETTGPEIWRDTEGQVDLFVATIGSGGTVTGTGRYLKERNPEIRVYGVEPKESPLLTEGHAGPHGIQGIGANFVPEVLDRAILDEVITVSTQDALQMGRDIAAVEGILCGISSGACVCAAIALAQKSENRGKRIVCVLPDTGERYLSTEMFA